MKVRDRIRELRRVKASDLRPSPRNWRTHPQAQLDALRGILAEVGIAGAALGRELADGTIQLIDGHARAETLGDEEMPVLILDVTEEEADKLLATFDPLGAMAGQDAAKLDSLLNEIAFDSPAVQAMLDSLLDVSSEEDSGDADEPATAKTLFPNAIRYSSTARTNTSKRCCWNVSRLKASSARVS